MKRILGIFCVAFLFLVSTVAFSACGCTTPPEEIDISDTMASRQNYLLTSVYNKPAGTDFDTAEGASYVSDANYYVTVKTGVTDILTSITIAGVRFEDDDTVSLSVGNANYLVRNAWKLDDQNLKIASGLLLASTSEEGKVEVLYSNKALSLTILDTPSDIDFEIEVEGANADLTGPVGGVYTYTSSNYAGYFKIKALDNEDNSLLDEDSVITVRKVRKENGEVVNITYGFTKADLVGGDYVIQYFPAYNAGEAFTEGDPANHTMEFHFHILGVGADTITYNFVNSATTD